MENKKVLKEARAIFNNLKTDPNSVLLFGGKNRPVAVEKTEKIEVFIGLSATKTYTVR